MSRWFEKSPIVGTEPACNLLLRKRWTNHRTTQYVTYLIAEQCAHTLWISRLRWFFLGQGSRNIFNFSTYIGSSIPYSSVREVRPPNAPASTWSCTRWQQIRLKTQVQAKITEQYKKMYWSRSGETFTQVNSSPPLIKMMSLLISFSHSRGSVQLQNLIEGSSAT